MKHFISARHGSYDRDNRLSDLGAEQMRELASAIRKYVGENASYRIVCSTAPRAKDSAIAFAQAIGHTGQIQEEEYLWSANDAPKGVTYYSLRDRDRLRTIIEEHQDEADVIVCFSHLGVAEAMAIQMAKIVGVRVDYHDLGYGQGFLISKDRFTLVP
jgi:broad specificity phosphatase PhoE